MNVGIIGLGLIGGSIALKIKEIDKIQLSMDLIKIWIQ